MEGRRTQRAVREQNAMMLLGVLFFIGGVILIATWLFRPPGQTEGADANVETEVAGITAVVDSTTTGPATTTPILRSFTLAITGDVVPPAGRDDYRPLFAAVKPILTPANLALCHITTEDVEPEVLEAIADAGYDGCAPTASTAVHDVNGVQVAVISATATDATSLSEAAQAARASGAQVVVVSIEWGDANRVAPTEDQMLLASELSSVPDIDLLVGHGAGVVQPVVAAGQTVVAYGLGEFLAPAEDGVILEVRFDETAAGSGEFRAAAVAFTPTRVLRDSSEIVPIATMINDPEYNFDEGDREVLTQSAAATKDAVTLLDDVAQPSGK